MTTELETNIVAVERVKEYRETLQRVIVLIFIYIPTQGVVSENDNRVRDKHCSCRESEGKHTQKLSYRRVQRVKQTAQLVLILYIYIPTQGVVSEMTTELETNICSWVVSENNNRVRDKHCSCRRVKEYTETPTEVNNSYFIYIPTQGVVSENDNRVRDKHCSCRRVKEYTETPGGVVSENDNRVRDKHCSCRESEGIHRNSYRGVVSENDNRVRDKHCSCRESEGIHRNSYRGVVSENDNRLETNIVAVERVKEYTETPTESVRMTTELETIVAVERVKGIQGGVVSENDNRVRDKHCSCRESEGIHRNSYRGVVSENDSLETNIVAVERVKEYTETPTEVNSSYFIYIPTQGVVVSENDNRVRDKHCSCRESEGIHRNSYRGK
ncbi:unnamed protein product [Mytilus edulis]|uniref:Uncharacterized protein n=1 Tax=Mytilus edulis TaxID=6550 RepID=A0A8S3TEQ0_MYTED|nr:unnamed protein product [Mytilus edulis]